MLSTADARRVYGELAPGEQFKSDFGAGRDVLFAAGFADLFASCGTTTAMKPHALAAADARLRRVPRPRGLPSRTRWRQREFRDLRADAGGVRPGKLPLHRYVAGDRETHDVLGWVSVVRTSDRCVYAGVVERSVYVVSRARGRGVGAPLLQALIGLTEAVGVWTIQSGIFPENTVSLRLQERVGFRVVVLGDRRDVVLVECRSSTVGTDQRPPRRQR